jgi:cell division protein FtsB
MKHHVTCFKTGADQKNNNGDPMSENLFQPEKKPTPKQPLTMREQAIASALRAWRPAGTILAVALAALVMWHVVNGNHGLSVWHQMRSEDRGLQKQIKDVQQENAQLRQQIDRLKSDPDAIEHEAREKLHYAKSGEIIYSLPTPPPSQPAPAPTK